MITAAAVAIALGACNSPEKQAVDSKDNAPATEQQAAPAQATDDGKTAIDVSKVKSAGSPEADALEIAEKTVEISKQMLNGQDVVKAQDELQRRTEELREYYKSKDQLGEFVDAVNAAVAEKVNNLADQLKAAKQLSGQESVH